MDLFIKKINFFKYLIRAMHEKINYYTTQKQEIKNSKNNKSTILKITQWIVQKIKYKTIEF